MKVLKNIFWNGEQQRLRAAWRLLIQLLMFFALVIGLALLTSSLGSGFVTSLLGSLIYLGGGLGAVWLLARVIDHRLFADYGFHLDRAWLLDLGFGLFLGAFLMTGILLTEMAAGWVQVAVAPITIYPLPIGLAVLIQVLVYCAVGVNEELAFRGYPLKNIAEGLAGKWLGSRAAIVLAVAISSVVFGLGHMTNDNATATSTLNIVLAGWMLNLPFILTGELALSIGLHITWNLFEGTVYGFAVSGSQPSTHLLSIQQTGADLWIGGAFGPEAGLVCIAWMLIGCGLVVAWIMFHRHRLKLHLPLAKYAAANSRGF